MFSQVSVCGGSNGLAHSVTIHFFFKFMQFSGIKKTKIIGLCPLLNLLLLLLPPANEVWGKVYFKKCVSRILSMGGGLSQHALQVVSQHALQQVSRGYPSMPCRFSGPHPRGSLGGSGWGRGVSRPTPKEEVERDLARGVPAPREVPALGVPAPGECLL